MSMTLNLVDHLLVRARTLQSMGLFHEAVRLYARLGDLRTLPASVAEETQKALGELRLKRGQFKKARRHLAAAIASNPSHAGYHYMMAGAVSADDSCEAQRAIEHLRQAVELEPRNAEFWCELGLQALELGHADEGLRALRRAAELAPDSPSILAKVAGGLRSSEQTDAARNLLRAAQFRNPRDRRFQRVWNDFQFQALHEEQQASRRDTQPEEAGPVVLPFARFVEETGSGRIIRKDRPSSPHGPHAPRHSPVNDRKPA